MPKSGRSYFLSARVRFEVFEIVDQAARLRGWDRSKVIEIGAEREARRIIEVAVKTVQAHRRTARAVRSRARRLRTT
jgi:uncharacterized protein (DUF1778 family)